MFDYQLLVQLMEQGEVSAKLMAVDYLKDYKKDMWADLLHLLTLNPHICGLADNLWYMKTEINFKNWKSISLSETKRGRTKKWYIHFVQGQEFWCRITEDMRNIPISNRLVREQLRQIIHSIIKSQLDSMLQPK